MWLEQQSGALHTPINLSPHLEFLRIESGMGNPGVGFPVGKMCTLLQTEPWIGCAGCWETKEIAKFCHLYGCQVKKMNTK